MDNGEGNKLNPGFKIQISNDNNYYDQPTTQKSNDLLLKDDNSRENGASRFKETKDTISDRKEINTNSSFNNGLKINGNNNGKQVTSIVIEKTSGNKISEIKVKYNKEKDGDILIKFSNNKSKQEKPKSKKASSKLKLDDQRNSIVGKYEKNTKTSFTNKKDKDNKESPMKESKRFDYFGNHIIKDGKQKVYIKPDIEFVQIKSHKGALYEQNKDNVKCECACMIF